MLSEDFISDVNEAMNELNTPSGTLTFPLPMCDSEFRTAQNGGRYRSVLWDLDQDMRATNKYDSEPIIRHHDDIELTETERQINTGIHKATEYWRDRLWRLMDDYGMSLDDD